MAFGITLSERDTALSEKIRHSRI